MYKGAEMSRYCWWICVKLGSWREGTTGGVICRILMSRDPVDCNPDPMVLDDADYLTQDVVLLYSSGIPCLEGANDPLVV